jgi:hypothetical protein
MAEPFNIADAIDLTYTSSDFKARFGSKASGLPAAIADRLRAGGANVQLISPQPGVTLPSNTELSTHMTLNPGERIDAMDKAFPNANPIFAITVRTAEPYTVASAHLVSKNPNGGHDLKQIFHQAADTSNFSAANIDKWADEIAKGAAPAAMSAQTPSGPPAPSGNPAPQGKGMLDDIPDTPGMFKVGPPTTAPAPAQTPPARPISPPRP